MLHHYSLFSSSTNIFAIDPGLLSLSFLWHSYTVPFPDDGMTSNANHQSKQKVDLEEIVTVFTASWLLILSLLKFHSRSPSLLPNSIRHAWRFCLALFLHSQSPLLLPASIQHACLCCLPLPLHSRSLLLMPANCRIRAEWIHKNRFVVKIIKNF